MSTKKTVLTEKVEFPTALYAHKNEMIELINAKVGAFAPMGLGYCSSTFRKAASSPVKYSSVGRLLDLMFVNKSCACIVSDDDIYGEVYDGTDYTRFVCDGKTVEYENEALPDVLAIIPFALFELRNSAEIKEFKDAFSAVRKAVDTGASDKELITSVALFCDTYWYAIAKQTPNGIVIKKNALNMDNVQQKAKDGEYGPCALFSGMVTPKITGITTGKSSRAKATRPSDDDFFAAIKAGEYQVPYNWNETQEVRIPTRESLDSFTPSSTYFSLVSKIKSNADKILLRMDSGLSNVDAIGKNAVNLFITGKPGTGKTTLAYALGAATQMPVYTVALTKNTEEDTFQGMNKVVDGALKFVSTDFLDAYTNGGIIILEEINLADPAVVMGALGQAIEFPYILMKDGYIPVKRHPLCIIIGTMNIGTFGSKGVNQALSSRFRQSYMLNDPTKDDFIKILVSTGAKKREANWVFSAYQKMIDYLKSPAVNAEDACLNLTLRGCIGALENIAEGENPKEAIHNTLIGKISELDLALAEDVYKNVILSLPELY